MVLELDYIKKYTWFTISACINTNSRWIIGLNVKENYKTMRRKPGNLFNIDIGKDFLEHLKNPNNERNNKVSLWGLLIACFFSPRVLTEALVLDR
jgi:hypothetical protein